LATGDKKATIFSQQNFGSLPMLPTLTLKPLYHRGNENTAVVFNYNTDLSNTIKKIKDARWSQTHKCWYLPLGRQHYDLLKNAVSEKAIINDTALRNYLQQKKAVKPLLTREKVSKQRSLLLIQHPLNDVNLEAFTQYQAMLQLKGYSVNTIKNYSNEFHFMLRLLGSINVTELNKHHIHSYLLWLLQKKKYSEAHLHTTVNAIKFYFEKLLKRESEFFDLPRPKKPELLPDVLSQTQIARLFKSITNLKHKTLIMTCYAAGLRVSEVVNLKIRDIDSERMMIHIRAGKGKKDRMIPLSEVLLKTLREYFKQYRPREFLFEGENKSAYSTRSAQLVLAAAKKRAGIFKKGSIHSLRHSYATHLMESGIDIRFIQEALGHNSLNTTIRYTHVSQRNIGKIGSPLDKIQL
jgi:integrase/recombinase XerD